MPDIKKKKKKKLIVTFEGNPNGNLEDIVRQIIMEKLRNDKIID